jgi:hypothetical protein
MCTLTADIESESPHVARLAATIGLTEKIPEEGKGTRRLLIVSRLKDWVVIHERMSQSRTETEVMVGYQWDMVGTKPNAITC